MGVSFSSTNRGIAEWQGELLDEGGALIRKLAPAAKQQILVLPFAGLLTADTQLQGSEGSGEVLAVTWRTYCTALVAEAMTQRISAEGMSGVALAIAGSNKELLKNE
jgi:hypothetical protein